MPTLSNIIESIIFVSEEPISSQAIHAILVQSEAENSTEAAEASPLPLQVVEEALAELLEKYQADTYAFEVRHIAGGYQFLTKKDYFTYVKQASLEHNKKRLSKSALETLSIIAYRQPVTKSEIEFIRGVNSDYATQKLLEKKLIAIVGRSDGPGKPLLYGTSTFFMQYFGISAMDDLPKLKEFEELEEAHLERFKQFQEEKNEAQSSASKEEDHGEKKPEESKP